MGDMEREVDHAKALREFGSYNVMCEAADYIDRLRAERDALRRDSTALRTLLLNERNEWYAQHKQHVAERDALRELLKESRHVIQYAFDGESADDPHDADENKMYSETLARIDAALLNPPGTPRSGPARD
jgi:hypothetical protein